MTKAYLSAGLAVLTGSASGLGYAMAEQCCQHGSQIVILSDIRQEALDTAVERLQQQFTNVKVVGFLCDVSVASSVEQLLFSIQSKFPTVPITFLAANAGVLLPKSTVLTGTMEEWEMT
mgnify:CR=1 FL=1